LEYLSISLTQEKVLEGRFAGQYFYGEFYQSDINQKTPIYSALNNPIDALLNVLGGIKVQFQILAHKGYTISDPETKQEWFLEKKIPEQILQEQIDKLKSNENISVEDKKKIFKIWKQTWGQENSPLKNIADKLNYKI